MKLSALLLLAAGLCVGGQTSKTFVGVVHDNRCAGPNCARQCPITKGPTYTLQSGDEAWVLSDQKTPSRYVGRKVIVRGAIGPDNKLHVDSIAPAS
jgi:hypothetical protein